MRYNIQVVHKNGIHAGINTALDIRIKVITYHDAFIDKRASSFYRVFKYFFVGFQAVAGFGCNHFFKKSMQVGAQ